MLATRAGLLQLRADGLQLAGQLGKVAVRHREPGAGDICYWVVQDDEGHRLVGWMKGVGRIQLHGFARARHGATNAHHCQPDALGGDPVPEQP